jgi:hypothetical protein
MSTPAPKKFLLAGWNAFAEERGVNKKEPMESFDWCESYDKHYLSDCRDALEKVEGAKEWLKTYTCGKKEYPFSTGLGPQIVLTDDHSGASFNATLWAYKYLLNNWDTYVYEQKKNIALDAYKAQIPPSYVYRRLLANCKIYLTKNSAQMYDLIMGDWSTYSPEGEAAKTVDEIQRVMTPLVAELDELDAEDKAREAERVHNDLIGSLEFLYEHPSRWFDTPNGCSLSPGHPIKITSRALNEMEQKYPGYKHKIELIARAIPKLNTYPSAYRNDDSFMVKFMGDQGVLA